MGLLLLLLLLLKNPRSIHSHPRRKSSEAAQSGILLLLSVDAKNRSIFIGASNMTKKIVTRTREKKVYSLPGQKFDVPEEREPLRIFYKLLSKQIPSSEMAEFWLVKHGMLSPEIGRKAYEKTQRKAKQLQSGTPIKSHHPLRQLGPR